MGIGGQIKPWKGANLANLALAYTGVTGFPQGGWNAARAHRWVLDYIHHGRQPQRIGRGKEFMRLSNVAALYAPGLMYREYREKGGRLDESYILFDLRGQIARHFRALTRNGGYCHIQDPDQLIGERLRHLGEMLFHRKPQFEWLVQGLFLELIGLVMQSSQIAPHARTLRVEHKASGPNLPDAVERYIRARVTETIRIRQLAAHVHMSESVFAHAYPPLAGESPYRTILRLKMETAKRRMLKDHLSVKETADRLGFSSEFHFSRIFKRMEGIAPSLYQKAFTKER
ncbi:MAG: helix-turn-helix transcriptional regulator [Verrucomicrobia bacterium]|nr:helix-turn-helix transcriptional regulator [Verrucomicrobiota bacterium]